MIDGVVVLDKPTGLSSASAVEKVKRRLAAKRAGHGGTLDPLATGVLPICLGAATKLAGYLLSDDKAYEVELVLGVETDTYDRTGTVVATRDASGVTREAVERALAALVGEHDQLPPMFSAIKQDGVRLYEHARAGRQVERAPRRVRVDSLELVEWAPPRAKLAIACGKGTYVRSLVADVGRALGCGAHVAELRRTRSGEFTLAMARGLDDIASAPVVPLVAATRLPIVRVRRADDVARIRSGLQQLSIQTDIAEQFQLVDESDRLLAIAHIEGGKFVYDRGFLAP